MKLIRDKVPLIMSQAGVDFEAKIADNDEYKTLLHEKMNEEIDEFRSEPSVEEAADMYEVFLAIIKNWGFDLQEVIDAADSKREIRGGFGERVVLLESGDIQPVHSNAEKTGRLFGEPPKRK